MDQRLEQGSLATTTATTIYTVPTTNDARIYGLVLTNTQSNAIVVDITINTYLLRKVTIPGGEGKVKVIKDIQALAAGDVLILTPASTDGFNYYLSGRLG